jgi:hypothetical protein
MPGSIASHVDWRVFVDRRGRSIASACRNSLRCHRSRSRVECLLSPTNRGADPQFPRCPRSWPLRLERWHRRQHRFAGREDRSLLPRIDPRPCRRFSGQPHVLGELQSIHKSTEPIPPGRVPRPHPRHLDRRRIPARRAVRPGRVQVPPSADRRPTLPEVLRRACITKTERDGR